MSINDLLDTPPPARGRYHADDHVPNLRGGPSAWVLFLVGPLLAALVTGGGIVWVIARMPDGTAWTSMRDDITTMKLKLAAQEATKAAEADAKTAEARAVDEHNKLIDYKLDQLLNKKGNR